MMSVEFSMKARLCDRGELWRGAFDLAPTKGYQVVLPP